MAPGHLQMLEFPRAPAVLHKYSSAHAGAPCWWLLLEPDFVTTTSLYCKPLAVILIELFHFFFNN